MDNVTTLPRSRPLTVADLETVPDDGHRYELLDGSLVVTPAPGHAHQRASHRLSMLLDRSCPGHLEVLAAPFDVVLADDTLVRPDLLVARREDFTPRDLRKPPVLAVEILSPSTALIDLNLKRARYQSAGVPSYWVVDPDQPRLRAWDLVHGEGDEEYVEVADVAGDEAWTAARPFAVTVVPGRLLD